MDKEWEEQLERFRQFSARVGQLQEGLAANRELIAQRRAGGSGTPLDDVRDFRLCEGPQHHRRQAPKDVDVESSGARHRRRRASSRRR
jgi:hypothetical protein